MSALRKMLNDDQLVTAPVVSNPIMAELAERAGLPALYLGGGTLGSGGVGVRSRVSRWSRHGCRV
jgi:2-methylisocitrate lyase-like PEP mutase family enzyme